MVKIGFKTYKLKKSKVIYLKKPSKFFNKTSKKGKYSKILKKGKYKKIPRKSKEENDYFIGGRLKEGNFVRFQLFTDLTHFNRHPLMKAFLGKHLMANVFVGKPKNIKVRKILNKFQANYLIKE